MKEASARPFPWFSALRVLAEPLCRHLGWLGLFVALAPMIGPRGYGVFALALSGIAIVEALLSAVAGEVLAALPHADDRHLSTAFVTVLAAGAAVSGVLYAVAGPIDAMLDEASFGDMFRSLSLLPLLGALAVAPRAQLQRQARQARIVAATVSGLASGGGVALALAWAGAGPWSLVAQIVVQRFVECATLWLSTRPGVEFFWSRRHFVDLVGRLDLRALTALWPAVAQHGPCLLVGMTLGPVAAGLYLLAARFGEMTTDLALACAPRRMPSSLAEALHRAGRVAFPAVLGASLLPIAVPPLLEPRWWGAIEPAQILLLAAIPAVVALAGLARRADRSAAACQQTLRAVGGLIAAGVAVPYGLETTAVVILGYLSVVAVCGLWQDARSSAWGGSELAAAARPFAGALAAGLLLSGLADPVGASLAPAPALCLLGACGRLCYLVVCGVADMPAPRWSLRRVNPA